MKNVFVKVLSGVLLMTFLVFGYGAGAMAAPITKTLNEDTKLIPHGLMAIDFMPIFKKGTTVTLNENGEVIEGILAENTPLQCVSFQGERNGRLYFRQNYGYIFHEGTKVTFNDNGEVVRGTFSHNPALIAVPVCARSDITLAPLTEVSFHPNGIVASGTLDVWRDIFLRPVGWKQLNTLTNNTGGFVKFKDKTIIELNDKGEVTKGVLEQETKLLSPTGSKTYEKGTTVEFDDKGFVIKANK